MASSALAVPGSSPFPRSGPGDEPQRPRRLAVLNGLLEESWRRGWSRHPSLDPGELVARARTITGLDDAGGGGWQDRLERLSEALHAEAALSPLGHTIAHGQLVAALATRLRAHALWRRYPEIAAIPTPAPIIVVGQMRSGTTRMQRLLACDPRFAHTRFFESWNPLPRRFCLGALDDRRLRAWVALRSARLLSPEFDAIHPTALTEPDEEIGFHSVSLFGASFETQWRVPGFARHGEATDPEPVYAEFKKLLQTVAWYRCESTTRPWILKVPQMTQDLPAVLRVFPDARLVFLDREPTALVASSASLALSQMRLQSDAVDPHWIGAEWLRKVALRQRRTDAFRRTIDTARVEVGFDAMTDDWRTQMHRVYAMLGLPLTPEVETRMAAFQSDRRHARLAHHRYDLGDFGLTEVDVDRTLAPQPLSPPPATC